VNLLAVLENGLFALGQVMRFPVMVLLWGCVAGAVYMSGSPAVASAAASTSPPGSRAAARSARPMPAGACCRRRFACCCHP
jgi:hypothetical protein